MSSTRPFFAARAEEVIDRWVERALRSFGWREKVISYTGYGTTDCVRILARVVLVPGRATSGLAKDVEEFVRRRGFRNFVTAPCVRNPIKIVVGDLEIDTETDRGGYLDCRVHDHGLAPGWRQATLRSRGSKPVKADVQVVGDDVDFGIVSDIDDTVITTWLPRPLIAGWNSFIRDESYRQAPPAMAWMYRQLVERHPGAPVVYISTGAWNTHPFLARFLKRHRFPPGPMLLTDWGPTNTGFFRSGAAHKVNSMHQLTRDFPNIKWLLIGDDGQHDPELYSAFAAVAPEYVRAILIRQLTPTEQLLAHGSATALTQFGVRADLVPSVEAPDGRGLLAGWNELEEA
ncbi:MAG: DUF2183 domain-containing protein [Propionibacteriaceae bacterium]|jgi:phosphatidate phosphatase APP1|nr:DUF2183 domain-containing protein [Propionibacteriaceae bacterium]